MKINDLLTGFSSAECDTREQLQLQDTPSAALRRRRVVPGGEFPSVSPDYSDAQLLSQSAALKSHHGASPLSWFGSNAAPSLGVAACDFGVALKAAVRAAHACAALRAAGDPSEQPNARGGSVA